MSRILVTVLFGSLAASSALAAVEELAAAWADSSMQSWSIAGYAALKTAVVFAFTVFVAVRRPPRRSSRRPLAFASCALALGSIVALRGPDPTDEALFTVVGDVLTLFAGAWILASAVALGSCFGILPEARGLVIRGPYRLVRHPLYLGEIGACAGLALAAPSLWNLGVTLVFVAAQAVRMRLEEQALTEEFPEYGEYSARTPRLLPRFSFP